MPDTENTYDNLDVSIREQIVHARETYNACTARWVAMQLNMSPDVCRHRLLKMQEQGLVDWNEMPGSLVVVPGTPMDEAEQGSASTTSETPASEQPDPPAAPAAPAKAKAKRPAKKAPAKKRAAAHPK